MSEFDAKAFQRAACKPREQVYRIEATRPWFDGGADPDWRVRGLTGAEMAEIYALDARQARLANLADLLVSKSDAQDKAAEIKASLGLSDGLPSEARKRLELFVRGAVAPTADLPLARTLLERYPVDFYALTNKIMELTGLGAVPDVGESPGSTATPT